MTLPADSLLHGELAVVGQLVDASNASLLCSLSISDGPSDGPSDGDAHVIYKPLMGERPLWDFPEGTLSHREVAAFIVSESLGWNIVPPTVWRDGPFGPGMVQEWVDVDESVDLVALVQSDHPELRRMAVFDALINNGDRKGGHVLPTADGHLWGIDHGVTFAIEDKLRTVLWQWRGNEVPAELLEPIDRWLKTWNDQHSPVAALSGHLSEPEMKALRNRGERLIETRTHPEPSADWPAIPWPPF
jgi:uncharacterized repeat protein (TIGR03843 family)